MKTESAVLTCNECLARGNGKFSYPLYQPPHAFELADAVIIGVGIGHLDLLDDLETREQSKHSSFTMTSVLQSRAPLWAKAQKSSLRRC